MYINIYLVSLSPVSDNPEKAEVVSTSSSYTVTPAFAPVALTVIVYFSAENTGSLVLSVKGSPSKKTDPSFSDKPSIGPSAIKSVTETV